MDWAEEPATIIQQLLTSLFVQDSRSHSTASTEIDSEIPEEYRRCHDAKAFSHGSEWVHSHIATRLATAGDDQAAGSL